MKVFEGNFDGKGIKIAIVASRFNELAVQKIHYSAIMLILMIYIYTEFQELLKSHQYVIKLLKAVNMML